MPATKNTATSVLVTFATGKATRFSSIGAASRALSGDGSDRLSTTIRRRLRESGGYIGANNAWVERAPPV